MWAKETIRGQKSEERGPGGLGQVGKVVKKLTSPTKIKGHKVAASKDKPEFLVESDKSGKRAAHKADALTKA